MNYECFVSQYLLVFPYDGQDTCGTESSTIAAVGNHFLASQDMVLDYLPCHACKQLWPDKV
jgi:hypothetical protein